MISSGKEMLMGRKSNPVLSVARFRGKLGAAIAVITSLIVGFLALPNNILYLIDSSHAVRGSARDVSFGSSTAQERSSYDHAYIHGGIAVITMGCLAMVVSVVLSFFAAKSKRKMDDAEEGTRRLNKSTRTVLACLIMMNLELFMAVVSGCMELLYRPLIRDEHRMHNVECAIAVFNILIYAMYVITMVLTSTVLKERQGDGRNTDAFMSHNAHRDGLNAAKTYGDGDYYSQSSLFL